MRDTEKPLLRTDGGCHFTPDGAGLCTAPSGGARLHLVSDSVRSLTPGEVWHRQAYRVSVASTRSSSAKTLFWRDSRSFSRKVTLIASLPGQTVSSQFMPAAACPVYA